MQQKKLKSKEDDEWGHASGGGPGGVSWNVPFYGTDDYGFNALPAEGNITRWWNSTEENSYNITILDMSPNGMYFSNSHSKNSLFSIRCLKD